MPGNLLNSAAEFFKSREQRIQKYIQDDRGKYAFVSTVQGADGYKSMVIVAARKRFFTRRGKSWTSFMEKLAQRAADADARLVLFTLQATTRQWLVFDPQAVLDYGKPPGDESQRKQEGEDWLDIPASWGVDLVDFVERRATPQTEPSPDDPFNLGTEQETLDQGLDRFATDGGEPQFYGWDHLLRTERAVEVLKAAPERWGEDAQVNMMGEEAAELSRAVHRFMNGRDGVEALAEEVVDARILMDQLAVSGIIPQSMLQDMMEDRLDRLEGRVFDGWDGGPDSER